ncbi:MAG: exodeoxyribonuclease VII small subunit [Halofilum sp. (in: g-proteobacteria)]|nr:exodeoxyribonuclease VII small subunit [Halofilum sp. (in: g-proteobacteria)]
MTAKKKTAKAGDGGEAKSGPARFEESLRELEELVEALEKGDLTLEESLARFERGVTLARECRDSLAAAEQRVQVLLSDEQGNESLAPFATGAEADPADRDPE